MGGAENTFITLGGLGFILFRIGWRVIVIERTSIPVHWTPIPTFWTPKPAPRTPIPTSWTVIPTTTWSSIPKRLS